MEGNKICKGMQEIRNLRWEIKEKENVDCNEGNKRITRGKKLVNA